jgi:hypothetical protein
MTRAKLNNITWIQSIENDRFVYTSADGQFHIRTARFEYKYQKATAFGFALFQGNGTSPVVTVRRLVEAKRYAEKLARK